MGECDHLFNEDQLDYMHYLAKLKPEQKCACGWYRWGECWGTCYGDAGKGGYVEPKEGGDADVSATERNASS